MRFVLSGRLVYVLLQQKLHSKKDFPAWSKNYKDNLLKLHVGPQGPMIGNFDFSIDTKTTSFESA